MEYKITLKKIGMIILVIFSLILSLKLFTFYIPFLIAYLISLLIEPIIKFVNKKTNLSRKTSSVIVLIAVFGILIFMFALGTFVLVSESSNLLSTLNTYLDSAISAIKDILEKIDLDKLNVSNEVKTLIENSSTDVLNRIIDFLKGLLNTFLEKIKSVPTMLIYIFITILSTYFITSDKFYIKDRLEHHIPKKILGKISTKIEKITKTLCGYLKAELIMVGITFLIVLMGLNIFYLIGMDVGYPLLIAILISFVDALPILGSGTVMVPWGIFLLCNKQYSVGFSILGLYLFVLAVRQFLEPKIVSNKIGVHPIFTLIAMYTGFKIMGILGLLLGPIVLIVLKNVFENTLDKGLIKYILE